MEVPEDEGDGSSPVPPSATKKPSMLIWVIVSCSSLIIGFVMVLIVLHLHLVPLRQSLNYVRSRCLIVNIINGSRTHGKDYLHNTPKSYDVKSLTREESAQRDHNDLHIPFLCHPENLAALVSRTRLLRDLHDSNTKASPVEETCMCAGVCYSKEKQDKLFPGILQPKDHLGDTHGKSKCFCHSSDKVILPNSSIPALTMEGQIIRIGEIINCVYRPGLDGGDQLTANTGADTSTWNSLKIILWPSLLFIAGFVGTFFSCIFYQNADTQRVR